MVKARWFESFFDARYLEILQAQKGRSVTRDEVDSLERALDLPAGARILDVACGYGRHAAELARRGYTVVGVDSSRTMLEEARRRCERVPRASFVRLDMRRIRYRREFDGVINMFTSFGYFSASENFAVLRRMAQALKPGGKILIDHRDRAHDERRFLSGNPIRTWWAIGPGRFTLEHARFDPSRGVIESTWLMIRTGERRSVRRSFRVQVYRLAEWRAMFRRTGLRLLHAYSGFDLQPSSQTATNRRLILVGERRG